MVAGYALCQASYKVTDHLAQRRRLLAKGLTNISLLCYNPTVLAE